MTRNESHSQSRAQLLDLAATYWATAAHQTAYQREHLLGPILLQIGVCL